MSIIPPLRNSTSVLTSMLFSALICTQVRAAERTTSLVPDIRACSDKEAIRTSQTALHIFEAELMKTNVVLDEIFTAWNAMVESPCFRLADQFVQFKPTSVESARQWWYKGGEKFLASYLELEDTKTDRWVALAPEFRDTLTRNSWAKWRGPPQVVSLPPEIFCSHDAQPCDPEAKSVILASEQDAEPNGCNLPRPRNRTEAGCKRIAKEVGTHRAFKELINCVDWRANKSLKFPVGSFNLPRTGWLVVSGTRGHYQRCTGTRAYNLEDGSSYRAETCEQDGTKGIKTVEMGRVAPTYIRRFLFLSTLRPYLSKRALEMDVFRIPPQVSARWTSFATQEFPVSSCIVSRFTHESILDVRWWKDRNILTSGTAVWHGPVDNIDGYIAKQLSFAETASLKGCVYSRLPAELQKGIERNDFTAMFKDQSFAPALCK